MSDQIVISMDLGSRKIETDLKSLYNTLKSMDAATASVKKGFDSLSSNRISDYAKLHRTLNVAIKDGTKYTKELSASYDLLKQKAISTKGSFSRLTSEMKRMSSIGSLLSNSMRSIFASMQQMFMQLPRGILDVVKLEGTYMGFRNALGVAEGTIDAANASLQTSIDIAKQLKLPINVVTKEYTKFMNAVRLVGFDTDEAVQAFTDLSKAARVLNLDQQSLSGMFLALEQMVSKGTVSMEELRRQLGNALPGAVDIAALAFAHKLPKGLKNVSEKVSAFIQLVREGKVNSVEFLRAFTPFLAKRVQPFLGEALNTSVAALTDLNNEFQKFKIRLGGILSTVVKPMVNSLTWLVEAINNLIGSNSVWVKEQTKVTVAIKETNHQIAQIKTTYNEVASSAESLTTSMGGVGIAMVGMTGGAVALRATFIALKSAALFALAPIGNLLTSIPLLGTYFGLAALKIKAFLPALRALIIANPIATFFIAATAAIGGFIIAMRKMNSDSVKAAASLRNLTSKLKLYKTALENATNVSSIAVISSSIALFEEEKRILESNIKGYEALLKVKSDNANNVIFNENLKISQDRLEQVDGALNALSISLKELKSEMARSADISPLIEVSDEVIEISQKLKGEYIRLKEGEEAYQDYLWALKKIPPEQKAFLLAQVRANEVLKKSNEELRKNKKATEELAKEHIRIQELYEEEVYLLKLIINDVETAVQKTEAYKLAKAGYNAEQVKYIQLLREEANLIKEMDVWKKEQAALIEKPDTTPFEFDKTPMEEYYESLMDNMYNYESVYVNAFKNMEDSMVSMMTTGKASFADMAKSILADLARMIAKQIIFNMLSGMFGGGGLSSAAPKQLALPGGGTGFINKSGVAKFDRGSDYIPRDGLAYLHKGEAVVPAKQNTTNNQKSMTFHNTFIINGVTDAASFKRNESQIMNDMQTKLAFANRNI